MRVFAQIIAILFLGLIVSLSGCGKKYVYFNGDDRIVVLGPSDNWPYGSVTMSKQQYRKLTEERVSDVLKN